MIVGDPESFLIIGAVDPAKYLKGLAVQLVRLGILAELEQCDAQVPPGDQNLVVLGTRVTAPSLDQFFGERAGRGVSAGAVEVTHDAEREVANRWLRAAGHVRGSDVGQQLKVPPPVRGVIRAGRDRGGQQQMDLVPDELMLFGPEAASDECLDESVHLNGAVDRVDPGKGVPSELTDRLAQQ